MLHNFSNWQATIADNWLANKQACKTIIVKQSFEFNDKGQVFPLESSAENTDIIMADEMLGEPNASSLTAACETMPFKQGFEIYGCLTAYPPKSKQAKVIEVYLSLYEQIQQPAQEQTTGQPQGQAHNQLTDKRETRLNKLLRVTGERQWQSSLIGTKASDPKVLSPVALHYENTYGGIDANKPDKVYEQNPAGSGYRLKQPKGQKLPPVEYPKKLLTHPKKAGVAASYAPIPQFWQPRLDLLPEIDERATMAGEYPFQSALPLNTYNYAPQDQQLAITFNKNLILSLKGLLPNLDYHQQVDIPLPYQPPQVAVIQGEHQAYVDLTCDTLVLDGDANSFHLIWRHSMATSELSPYATIVVQADNQSTQESTAEQQANSANNTVKSAAQSTQLTDAVTG